MKTLFACLTAPVLALGLMAAATAAPPEGFDARVNEVIEAHGVPGIAVAIVEDGNTVLAKGYGVRQLGTSQRVDEHTIFPIGSCSKAFTSAALAVLVDDGKIDWDDKVIDHLPGFQMYDPWVTREITIRDLLVHRSGLGLGAGDLMLIPSTSRTREEFTRGLRHIKPATSFRSGYAYDNVLYVVAGQVVEAVSGQSWETFVHDRLLKPAGMKDATAETPVRFATRNRAKVHARINGEIRGAGDQEVLDERANLISPIAAPAGGIVASASDMARWLTVQLNQGALSASAGDEDAPRLFSAAASREMWTPQTLMPINAYPGALADVTPQFSAYALGWTVQDYRGVKIIQHGGAVFGAQAIVVMIPSRNIGFSLEINSEDGLVLLGLIHELLDHYLDFPKRDWVAAYADFKASSLAAGLAALKELKTEVQPSKPSLPLAAYAGSYADPWYGSISIADTDGALRIDFEQSPGMVGTLKHWQFDTFRADWDDASIEPALVTFALDADGKVSQITMKPASPLADFSYDYQDLLFTPKN